MLPVIYTSTQADRFRGAGWPTQLHFLQGGLPLWRSDHVVMVWTSIRLLAWELKQHAILIEKYLTGSFYSQILTLPSSALGPRSAGRLLISLLGTDSSRVMRWTARLVKSWPLNSLRTTLRTRRYSSHIHSSTSSLTRRTIPLCLAANIKNCCEKWEIFH